MSHYLDGYNEWNWMAFVRCARHKKEQNMVVFQYHGCIYYRTIKDIPPGHELLVWYDGKYTQLLGIPLAWNDNRGKKLPECYLQTDPGSWMPLVGSLWIKRALQLSENTLEIS